MLKDNIKLLRQSKSLTQKELASYLSLSQQAIGKWEKGIAEPDSSNLCTLADYFGVTVDYLLGHSAVPAPAEIKNAPSEKDEAMLKVFHELNDEGREKVLAYISDLISSGNYRKKENKSKVV